MLGSGIVTLGKTLAPEDRGFGAVYVAQQEMSLGTGQDLD